MHNCSCSIVTLCACGALLKQGFSTLRTKQLFHLVVGILAFSVGGEGPTPGFASVDDVLPTGRYFATVLRINKLPPSPGKISRR